MRDARKDDPTVSIDGRTTVCITRLQFANDIDSLAKDEQEVLVESLGICNN